MLNNCVLNLYSKSSYHLELNLNNIIGSISSLAFIIGLTLLLGMQDQFEVTLEATHHGPHVDLPACFVEIGAFQFC
jgi:D-aminoacyl-tRNA deacylase